MIYCSTGFLSASAGFRDKKECANARSVFPPEFGFAKKIFGKGIFSVCQDVRDPGNRRALDSHQSSVYATRRVNNLHRIFSMSALANFLTIL